MRLLGLTGGVGMGKSTAAQLLSARGARVIDTDQIAHQVVEPGQPALVEIASSFGREVLRDDGSLRRDHLARLVFSDFEARKRLEAILHPLIRQAWLGEVARFRSLDAPLLVVVIPLLFETGAEAEFEATICIACSEATQLSRLAARGWPSVHARQRMDAQLPVEKKMAKADYLVWTEGSLEVHDAQLERVLQSRP